MVKRLVRSDQIHVLHLRALKRWMLFPKKVFSKYREKEEKNDCMLWLLCFSFNDQWRVVQGEKLYLLMFCGLRGIISLPSLNYSVKTL